MPHSGPALYSLERTELALTDSPLVLLK